MSRNSPALLCAQSALAALCVLAAVNIRAQDFATVKDEPGRFGGSLTVALRSEPKTLNPILSVDAGSREVIGLLNADLVHINRATQHTEPALAKSFSVSPDGRTYTLHLRRGLQFSDGAPCTADDVVFSFQLYLDEALHSPQRDLLVFGDKSIAVKKLDDFTVEFDLPKPYGPGERLFDSLAILPRHLLENAYRAGKLGEIWSTNARPSEIAGLGPFRLKESVAGQRIVLERNPYYWKVDSAGARLPYLSEITFLFVPTEDAQVIKFQSGETQLLENVSAANFAALQRESNTRNDCLYDLGPGLETVFLFFNLNSLDRTKVPEIVAKQSWFRDLRFRQAVSLAVDRAAMARLVYNGRATPIWGSVTPGNKAWLDANLPHPQRSLDEARALLRSAGFSWNSDGALLDAQSKPVNFTILVSSSNAQRSKMAAIAQDDLKQLGMDVQIVPLEFRSLVARVLNTKQYEAALMNLVNGDADPTPEMNLWLSSGQMHLWDLGESSPATPWEAELDRLMEAQATTANAEARKGIYDRAQELVAQNLPLIFLLSPNILVGARNNVGNFHPAILEPYALWNADHLFLEAPGGAHCESNGRAQ